MNLLIKLATPLPADLNPEETAEATFLAPVAIPDATRLTALPNPDAAALRKQLMIKTRENHVLSITATTK